MNKKYELVIFDLDGTLIDSLPYHFLAFKDLMLEYGIRIDDKHLKKLIGMSTNDILKDLKKKYKFKERIQDLREERRFHYFKFLGNRNIIFPQVRAALKKLHSSCQLAIATGSSKIILTHSTDKSFQELFDCIVSINDVRKGKPDPDELFLAARKLHAVPKKCLVVGDSIYDAIAAKSGGMDFIGVTTGYNKRQKLFKYGAIKVIDSIAELEKILK